MVTGGWKQAALEQLISVKFGYDSSFFSLFLKFSGATYPVGYPSDGVLVSMLLLLYY